MAKKKETEGTLFMALEIGAAWPAQLRGLKSSEGNFQAIVQANGETAEHFAGRTLDRWYRLLNSAAPPFRFMLGARGNPDDIAVAARKKIAQGVFGGNGQRGASELILWSADATTGEEQGRLLELAGSLLENHSGSDRSVRVLFGESRPLSSRTCARPRTRESRAA
jgi:hypothetical protein